MFLLIFKIFNVIQFNSMPVKFKRKIPHFRIRLKISTVVVKLVRFRFIYRQQIIQSRCSFHQLYRVDTQTNIILVKRITCIVRATFAF